MQLVVGQGQGVGRGRLLADQVAVLEPLWLPLRNRRRSAGRTDRSSVGASIPRRYARFSSSPFTAAGADDVGSVSNQARRVRPSRGSVTSIPSSSPRKKPVS